MPPGLCPRHHERCRRAPVRVCIPLPGCRGTAGRKVPFVRRTRVTPPYLSPRCRVELNEVLSDNLCVSRLIFRFLEIRFTESRKQRPFAWSIGATPQFGYLQSPCRHPLQFVSLN